MLKSEFPCPDGADVATIADMPKRKKQDTQGVTSSKSQTDVIRIDADLAFKIGVIVAIEGGSVSALVSPHLRAMVEKRYAEALKKAQEQQKP